MDWYRKYIECFFMWQDIYMRADKRIKELEKEVKRLREELNARQ